MSSLSSAYTPTLNTNQTAAGVSSLFNSSPFASAVNGTLPSGSTSLSGTGLSSTPIYAPGGSLNLPTPAPLQPLDTSSSQSTLAGIESQLPTAYNQGVTANQDLLKAITGGYQSLYGSQMAGLQGYGTAQQNALNQQFAQQQASTSQGLISSGLNNTTVAASEHQGVNSQQALANTQLAGQIQQQYLNTQQTNAGNYLSALQGVNLQYPTLDQMGSLAIAGETANNSTPPNPYLLAGAQGLSLAGGIGLGGLISGLGGSSNSGSSGSSGGGLLSGIGSLFESLA